MASMIMVIRLMGKCLMRSPHRAVVVKIPRTIMMGRDVLMALDIEIGRGIEIGIGEDFAGAGRVGGVDEDLDGRMSKMDSIRMAKEVEIMDGRVVLDEGSGIEILFISFNAFRAFSLLVIFVFFSFT
jgi:hypothetical protein